MSRSTGIFTRGDRTLAAPPGSSLLLASLLLLMSGPALRAQNDLKDIPDPDPEVERKSFQVAEGFEVNLFAADPLLAKPIQMNFDPAGRLWVASSEVYPQIKPGQVANDKIIVLEDRDGDGKAEVTRVFADGLLIPTAVEPGDGGAYVGNSTELLHLKDTDGDGKADARRVVLSGFGTEDTHHIVHTLRWGPEGLLYFNQSIYIHSHLETPHGVRRLNGGGIWQLRPETMRLEVFARGWVNSWGQAFDRFGQSFATDGAGGEGINYVLPGASYTTDPTATRIVKGLNPGTPKDCGLEVLGGRHLPEDWRGNLLTNDFRGNRVCRYVLSDDGAGFAAREQSEVIKTTHRAFRPIDVKMGPDGAIYIADWYNPIIQHGEVDFRDPRRDHTRGRIWRVTAKGRPLVDRPSLVDAPVGTLLDALKAPEDWTRQNAKRVMKELGAKTVLPALAAWVKALDGGDELAQHHRLEALWTYQTLDVLEPELLDRLLDAEDARVRAAAVRVVAHWHDRLPDPLALLASRVADAHPRVRLEAVRALAEIPSTRATQVALKALDRPMDQYLDYALWLTMRQLKPRWLPEVEAGRTDLGGDPYLTFALKAVGSPALVGPLLASLRDSKVAPGQEDAAIALIAALGRPEDLGGVLDLALADSTPSARRAALLGGLARASRQRKLRPAGDLARLGSWIAAGEEPTRIEAIRAAGLWNVEALRPALIDLARADQTPGPIRRAALEALADLGGTEGAKALADLAGPGRPLADRRLAVAALAAVEPKSAAPLAVDLLAGEGDPAELYSAFLRRKEGPVVLAAALADRTLPADAAKLGLRTVRGSGLDAPSLIEALTKAGKLGEPTELTSEQRAALVAEVSRSGDPARGEAIFRRKDLNCLKCHGIGGAGGQVGPDLSSIGASAPVDYLIDSLLQPNKAVKEGYHSLIVATDDGRVLTGIKVRQTDSALILRDADGSEVSVPLASIEGQKPGGSLMPPGLADILTRPEFVDLLRFLSELGKIGGGYTLGKERVARTWRVLEPTEVAANLVRSSSTGITTGGDARLNWSSAYSLVSGALPTADLPKNADGLTVVRCSVEVSTPGKVALALDSPEGLTLWVDGRKQLGLSGEIPLDLATGSQALTFVVDPARRPGGLRCELRDVPGSPARAQFLLGK